MSIIAKTASIAIGVVFLGVTAACAVDVPTVENFNADVANWADNSGVALLAHVASGGPDGSGYAATDFAFDIGGGAGGDSVVLFRGQDEFNSSGNAFVGDWVADGITTLTAAVRHNAPEPLTYFARFSSPGNFPGATAIEFAPVPPNVWTDLDFAISPASPQLVTFEGSDFDTVFSDLGHIQIGVSIPESLADDTTVYTFGLDHVVAVPEPAPVLLLAMAALVVNRRSRSGVLVRSGDGGRKDDH